MTTNQKTGLASGVLVVAIAFLTMSMGGNKDISATAINSQGAQPACTPTTTPWIRLTSPNGGETFTTGQQIPVSWVSCNGAGTNSLIALTSANGLINDEIGVGQTSAGSAMVTLPYTGGQGAPLIPSGTFYKIKIELGGNPAWSDDSNAFFTINSAPLPAGCSSPLGFSSTTGISCTSPTTFPSGCTSANGYSTTTGSSCNWTTVVPNMLQGCATTAGFSVTTGQACSNQFFISTVSSSSVANVSAVLNGAIMSGAQTGTQRWFKYGSSPQNLNTTTAAVNQSQNGSFATTVSGLTPATTYYFKACGIKGGVISLQTCGAILTFTTTGSGPLNTPTIVTSTSSPAHYVATNNSATDATKVTYNFSSTGSSAVITELKFLGNFSQINGQQTVSYIKVNGISAPFIVQNGQAMAYVTGLNINVPNNANGINVDAFVSYPPTSFTGSGALSNISLGSVKYTANNISSTMCVQSLGPCTSLLPGSGIMTPTMTLVGSKPSLTVGQSSAILAAGNIEIIKVTVSANAQGAIKVNSIPLTITNSSGVTYNTSANTIVVKDQNANSVPVTNTTFASNSTLIALTGGYTIPAGASATFSIYLPITNVMGLPGTAYIWSQISPSQNFRWTDVAGGATTLYTGSLLLGYPTTSSMIHN